MTGEVVSYSGPGPGQADSIIGQQQQQQLEIGDGRPASPAKRFPFQPYVDWDQINQSAETTNNDSPTRTSIARRSLGAGSLLGARRKSHVHGKSADEVERIAQTGKVRELKHCLRVHSWLPFDAVRSRLWQILCSVHSKDKSIGDSFYWDTVKQIYGTLELVNKTGSLPTFVEPSFQMSFYLDETGVQVARRVVNIISYSCPDITYAPSLYPIACLLLHYMSEEECYASVTAMVQSKKIKFITQTKLHYETIWRTAMLLSRKHAKSAVAYIAKQVGENSPLESVHQQWLTCIFKALPFQHLIRVMDCFLLEGRKVMYRTWMAILILFHRHVTSFSSNAGPSWNKDASPESALLSFCQNIPCSPEKLLRTAYGIRNFSSAEMDRLFVKTEMYLKSKVAASSAAPPARGIGPRSRSSDLLPTSQSQFQVQMMSHTLTIREGSRSPGPRSRSLGLYPIQGVRSVAADFDSLLTLWSWLPVRITMYQPELLYTTEEHGCSLTTFFHRVEQHEPTVMIVKTLQGDVFGAYCSTRWAERNCKDWHGNRQGYFGTGESFVFTLVPNETRYPWVGINSSSTDGPSCIRHAAELFMASDGHMFTIGGGKGHAIWVDENLRFGKTESCLTFNNQPLASNMDFEIKVLEVYGFQNS